RGSLRDRDGTRSARGRGAGQGGARVAAGWRPADRACATEPSASPAHVGVGLGWGGADRQRFRRRAHRVRGLPAALVATTPTSAAGLGAGTLDAQRGSSAERLAFWFLGAGRPTPAAGRASRPRAAHRGGGGARVAVGFRSRNGPRR